MDSDAANILYSALLELKEVAKDQKYLLQEVRDILKKQAHAPPLTAILNSCAPVSAHIPRTPVLSESDPKPFARRSIAKFQHFLETCSAVSIHGALLAYRAAGGTIGHKNATLAWRALGRRNQQHAFPPGASEKAVHVRAAQAGANRAAFVKFLNAVPKGVFRSRNEATDAFRRTGGQISEAAATSVFQAFQASP